MFQGTGALAFNATFYLQTNSDVFQAIQNGSFQGSALDHFVQFGQFEGRDPNAFFDTEYYLAENPDVLTAIADPANPSVTSAFQHFVMFGAEEGVVRAPSAQFEGFTEASYLAANPDVAAAVAAGQFANGFEHFLTFGVNEVRPGSGVVVDGTPGLPGETIAFTSQAGEILTGTANNDTFVGVIGADVASGATFQGGDQANGGAGTDRALLTAIDDGLTVGATTLNDIEQVFVRSVESGTTTLNTVLWNGVDQLWNDRGVEGSVVTFTNIQENVTLGLNGVQNGVATAVAGGSTLNAAFAAGAVKADSTLNVATNASVGTINVTGTGTAFTAIAIAATGASEVALAGVGAGLETVTVSGAGSLELTGTFTGVTTVDASTNTGGVELDLSANTKDVTVTGGAGADRFVFGDNLSKTDVVNGGAGFDTVVVSGDDFTLAADAEPFNLLTNVERVEFDGGSAVALDGDTFTNASITNLLFNNGGGVTIDAAGSARTYEFGNTFGGTAELELKSAATTLNVALLGDEGDGIANGSTVDALNVSYATGTAATAVTTVNLVSSGELTGVQTNEITGGIGVREGSTIVITGDADLTLGATRAVAVGGAPAGTVLPEGFTIDASAFTGDLTLAASAVQEDITLGAGTDLINFAAGTSGVVETVATVSSIVDFDVITGFTAGLGGDQLSYAGGTTASYDALTAAELSTIGSLGSLLAAANAAADTANEGDWTAFEFGGQTYALHNVVGADFSADDVLVQLSGVAVADLTADNFLAA